MKRTLFIALAALLAATADLGAQGSLGGLFLDASQDVAPSVSAPEFVSGPVAVDREWLVLVFINGVNDLGILGFADKSVNDMEQVGSNESMAVVVEYGVLGHDGSADRNLRFQRGSKTLYIIQDSDTGSISSPAIYSSNAADMGSAAHLVRFAKRAIRKYPAKKTAVVVWNHGGGPPRHLL